MPHSKEHLRPPNRGKRLTIRFDEREMKLVNTRARTLGLPPSAYSRAIILDAVTTEKEQEPLSAPVESPLGQSVNPELLRDLRTEVNHIGRNYNQAVRQMNKQGLAALGSQEAIETQTKLEEVLRRVEGMLKMKHENPS